MSITINEIAKIANVSKSTVSRAINNQKGVNTETRTRILSIMQDHNYQPNAFAQAMSSQKSNYIGVLMPSISDVIRVTHTYGDLLFGMSEVVVERGYYLLFCNSIDVKVLINTVQQNHLEGAFILGMGKTRNTIAKDLARLSIPIVSVGRIKQTLPNICHVDVDNKKSAKLVCQHLVSLGHKDIAVIKNKSMSLLSNVERHNALIEVLEENGIKPQDDLVIVDDLSLDGGYHAMTELLKRKKKFTACFAVTDNLAIGAIKALTDNNIRVPDDVSVVGFDGITYGQFITPTLTTVNQFSYQRGKIAANLLIDIIEGKAPSHSLLILGELIVRESTKAL